MLDEMIHKLSAVFGWGFFWGKDRSDNSDAMIFTKTYIRNLKLGSKLMFIWFNFFYYLKVYRDLFVVKDLWLWYLMESF